MPAKILVVEDDPDSMRVLTYALNSAGFEVVMAYGGRDAVAKVKRHMPDLVLTDLSMPEVSGVEVIYAIKQDPDVCHIPVLAVTSYVWEWQGRGATQVGCDGFIAKPVRPTELVEAVRRHLGQRAA
jgi:two-component system cell cycle response regulator DivK